MKLFFNNKTPVLTEDPDPSWQCPGTCPFNGMFMGRDSICSYFPKQCTEYHSYTLHNYVSDIFTL